MNTVLHKNTTRGLADHGWLTSRHTFSFASYYNPERMGFGLLCVINDDIVAPSMGFATHPHENMEIVSIPLIGSLRHRDSMGNEHVISAGEVQIMSAGTGLTHSEYNNSSQDEVKFLQIWVHPKNKNIAPRYGQLRFDAPDRRNRFQIMVSPLTSDTTVWINQDAWFSMAALETGKQTEYTKQIGNNGVYFFVIKGKFEIDSHVLDRRDGLGLTEGNSHLVQSAADGELLAIEVPMDQSQSAER
ncbi:MAG TPA: pirin family protein [Desulfopila sp.]|nr:pirin family protein [Desulfopila sp.]